MLHVRLLSSGRLITIIIVHCRLSLVLIIIATQARRYLAEKKVLVREVRAQRNQEQSISSALQSVLSFNTRGCNSPLTAAIDPAGPIPIARRAAAGANEDFRIGNW